MLIPNLLFLSDDSRTINCDKNIIYKLNFIYE